MKKACNPMRAPDLFSREINNEVSGFGEFSRILSAAIRALPHVSDAQLRNELKSAVCGLLLPKQAAA